MKPMFLSRLIVKKYTGENSPFPKGKDPGVELQQDFSFRDGRGIVWTAHHGDITDGASIPWLFKPIIGGSYKDTYFPAAVLHDVYGREQIKPKANIDRMFYEAMMANGVFIVKAAAMWLAVSLFGPQW